MTLDGILRGERDGPIQGCGAIAPDAPDHLASVRDDLHESDRVARGPVRVLDMDVGHEGRPARQHGAHDLSVQCVRDAQVAVEGGIATPGPHGIVEVLTREAWGQKDGPHLVPPYPLAVVVVCRRGRHHVPPIIERLDVARLAVAPVVALDHAHGRVALLVPEVELIVVPADRTTVGERVIPLADGPGLLRDPVIYPGEERPSGHAVSLVVRLRYQPRVRGHVDRAIDIDLIDPREEVLVTSHRNELAVDRVLVRRAEYVRPFPIEQEVVVVRYRQEVRPGGPRGLERLVRRPRAIRVGCVRVEVAEVQVVLWHRHSWLRCLRRAAAERRPDHRDHNHKRQRRETSPAGHAQLIPPKRTVRVSLRWYFSITDSAMQKSKNPPAQRGRRAVSGICHPRTSSSGPAAFLHSRPSVRTSSVNQGSSW